ncbi:MAG: hypothetical protein U9Q06_03490, partial [Nanoarchaeota archaeon]|nr:hypothetical protein [Nanoarchaeota archaeon]
MEQQKYLMKLQGLEGEANHLGEQLKVIDQQISEMNLLKENLNHLEKSGESEMFAELGKGIFIKATLKKSGLLVDVGNKVFVHKSVKDIC